MGKFNRSANCLFGARYMLTQIEALQGEIQGALIGDDIEHVHRMRVGSRRLRNGLNLFYVCLPKKRAKTWRKAIRKITGALGEARDLDIQIDLLNRACANTLEDSLKPGYNHLLKYLKKQRNIAQEKVSQTLGGLKERDSLGVMALSLKKLLRGSESTFLLTRPLYKQANKAIRSRLKHFLSYENFIDDPGKIYELHAMRIAGKHLRYTLEIFAPIYDRALDPFVRSMKKIQDLLGEIHDNDVWIEWLPEFVKQETRRIEKNPDCRETLGLILPGLLHFLENRKHVRAEQYQDFLALWEELQFQETWQSMRKVIKEPLNKGANSAKNNIDL
jgi:CHAD domain-containing protein